MDIFIVFKTDNWHSFASRDVIGVCTNRKAVLRVINAQIKKMGGKKLDDDQLFNLQNFKQTQGYPGDSEFVFDEYPANRLI